MAIQQKTFIYPCNFSSTFLLHSEFEPDWLLLLTVNKCGLPHILWTVLTPFAANVSVDLCFLEVVRCIVNISCIWSLFCLTRFLCLYFCGRKSFKVQEGQKPQPWRSNAVDDDADNENISCLTSLKFSINPSCMIWNVCYFLTVFTGRDQWACFRLNFEACTRLCWKVCLLYLCLEKLLFRLLNKSVFRPGQKKRKRF